jgi:hypothetical protein
MKSLAASCSILAMLVAMSSLHAGAQESSCGAPSPQLAALQSVDSGEDWFKVYVVAPGVFAIKEPRQSEDVNSFLIVGSSRAVLFDTGLGVGHIDRVVAKLTPLPVTVLNSHTHFEHVGYARPTLAADQVCGSLPAGVTAETTGRNNHDSACSACSALNVV